MFGSRRPAYIASGLLLALVALGLRSATGRRGDASPAASVASPVEPRKLLIGVDGVSWDAFQYARAHGLFKRFRFVGRQMAPYPSMSHPSWTEIVGTRRLFGARGNAHTVEARWFDLDAMRLADDPRQVFARQTSPYAYQRAFDYYFDPLIEPLTYLRGMKLFDREMDEAERNILDHFTGPEYFAYIGGPDAVAHTHRDQYLPYLVRLDAMVDRVADSLGRRGMPVEISLVSDHGNAGAFREGERETDLTTVSLDAAIARAHLAHADSGRLTQPDQVAVVTIALGTMANVYFGDLGRRRALATEALREPWADLATWLEVRGADRYVVILGHDGAEAHLRWRDGEYAYQRIHGDPLQVGDSLGYDSAAPRWISDARMRAATVTGPYPDAPFRLVQSATKQVENAPDLIVGIRDGYCYAGDMTRFVKMVRTHGNLGPRATFGIVASTSRQIPAYVRGQEVLSVLGLRPEDVLHRVADLAPGDPAALARALAAGDRRVPTGRDDESWDMVHVRRERVVALSMDYFTKDAMTQLLGAPRPDSATAGERGRRMDRTRAILRRADVVHGVANNVDTLLALADSLNPDSIPQRIDAAQARLRTIGELAPLTELRQLWSRGAGTGQGGGAPIRRGAMAMWTLPYFLDAALAEPESDSIADPRDPAFARRWYGGIASTVRDDPARLLDDSTLAPHLFNEIFTERKLWRSLEPSHVPLLYDPALGDITVVYVPGIYGELFDQEIWSRGMRAVRDRLGVRTVTIPVDGRCGSELNAGRIVNALRDDTRRRLERGYATPRYLLIGYSKGGIDASQALLRAPALARAQVAALVTIATPHRGTPVAERADIPAALVRWAVPQPAPAACDTAGANASLWPATRAAFWSEHEAELAPLTRFFSLSFTSDMEHAHPWMKLTKRIGRFSEPNDGVVPLSSSRFPAGVHAVNLGTVDADHIAGRLASSFPQEAFLEAVVLTVAELGALDRDAQERWRGSLASRAWRQWPRVLAGRNSRRGERVPPFAASLHPPAPLPGGTTGWRPDKTFRTANTDELTGTPVRMLAPSRDSVGFDFRCDQRDMLAFRREYEFYYDASNGGVEGDRDDGFSIVAANGSSSGRACRLATRGSAIKMTTVAFRLRPAEFPLLRFRVRVDRDLAGVTPARGGAGKNDAAFKLWLVLRDTRPTAGNRVVLLGYDWASPDAHGRTPRPDSLMEAVSSKRSIVISTLPEAWLFAVGGGEYVGRWLTVERDLAADLHRAYPDAPPDAFELVAVTLQSDSDESNSLTESLLDRLELRPRRSASRLTATRAR